MNSGSPAGFCSDLDRLSDVQVLLFEAVVG